MKVPTLYNSQCFKYPNLRIVLLDFLLYYGEIFNRKVLGIKYFSKIVVKIFVFSIRKQSFHSFYFRKQVHIEKNFFKVISLQPRVSERQIDFLSRRNQYSLSVSIIEKISETCFGRCEMNFALLGFDSLLLSYTFSILSRTNSMYQILEKHVIYK